MSINLRTFVIVGVMAMVFIFLAKQAAPFVPVQPARTFIASV